MVRDGKGPKRSDLSHPVGAQSLLGEAKAGDIQSLAKILTLIESDLARTAKFLAKIKPSANSLRIGITGPPGAGKSSLINLLIGFFRARKSRVAVLAVDPSSPFSGGALLGDRVRMGIHSNDKDVFIRSVGSRGGFGGLSSATGAMAAVLEECGYDIVIIETVGVGQTEIEVMNLADVTAVVLVPESGDVIQTLKAGILEIADVFVVNKSDRPGADVLARELEALVEQETEKKRPLFLTSTLKNEGVEKLGEGLLEIGGKYRDERRRSPQRLQAELRHLVLWVVDQDLRNQLARKKIANVYTSFASLKIPKMK